MCFGRRTNRRIPSSDRVASARVASVGGSSWFNLSLFFAGLLVCAGLLPESVKASQPSVGLGEPSQAEPSQETLPNEFWSFPASEKNDEKNDSTGGFSILVPLPSVDVPSVDEALEVTTNSDERRIARLLPSQPIPAAQLPSREAHQPTLAVTQPITPVESSPLPVLEELTEQQRLLIALSRDSLSSVTGVLTDGRVNELAKAKIQHAYAMASRSSLYVARQELIEVLRMISQAKDAQQGTPDRTKALASGLRALREAEDFAPLGTQLEAELDIKVLCASHRTPIAKQPDAAHLLPRLMMDRYIRYAQLQLALSVAGEPAGSMALHALGKLNSQLGRVEPEKNRLADRHAIAFQQAALLAHNQNYLAAHELGVLLATSGHYAESQQLLLHVASREPNAVVYRNLARVQEKLNQPALALASRDQARQLSRQGVTGTNNVQWVSPNQFAQGSVRTPRSTVARLTTAQRPATDRLVIPGSRSTAQRR